MKNKITSLQVGSIAYFCMLSCYIGITTYNTTQIVKEDGWISILIGFILGFIPLYIYIKIIDYKPDMSIIEKIENLFGKIFGKIINTLLAVSIMLMITLLFWDLTNFVGSQYLHRTPALFIGILFLIPIMYILTKDIKILGRVSFLLFIFSIILLFLSVLGLIFQVQFDNLFPILKDGIKDPIIGALSFVAYNVFALFLITIIPKNSMVQKEKLTKRLIKFYILGNISMFIMIFLIITVFGIEIANLYQYPEFHLLKRVSLFGFIDRVESTLSLRWLLYLFVTIVTGLFYFKEYIKITFNIKNNKINTLIILLISIILTTASNYLFPNNTVANDFIMHVLPWILYPIFIGIPIILLIKIKTTKN